MLLSKDEDNPHSQVEKKVQFSLEPLSASNDNVKGLRLPQIYYGHAELKWIKSDLCLRIVEWMILN